MNKKILLWSEDVKKMEYGFFQNFAIVFPATYNSLKNTNIGLRNFKAVMLRRKKELNKR